MAKYIIGTEYFLISRKDHGDRPKVEGTFLTIESAEAAKMEKIAAGSTLLYKIEARSVFDTESCLESPKLKRADQPKDSVNE